MSAAFSEPDRTPAAISTAVGETAVIRPTPGSGGTRKPTIFGGRCGGEHLVAVEPADHDVFPEHVLQGIRLGHRLDSVEIERVDVGEVLEHPSKLGRRAFDGFWGEVEAGQFGDLGDIGGGDPVQTPPRC